MGLMINDILIYNDILNGLNDIKIGLIVVLSLVSILPEMIRSTV